MRVVDVRDKHRRALVGVGAVAVAGLVACGAPSSSVVAGAAVTSGSSTASAGSTGACAGASGGGATDGARVTLSEADAGRTVCVDTGQQVIVRLKGDAARAWRVGVEGTALVAAADGRGSLPQGLQGASYRADHPGTARIVATRAVCPSPKPGEMACMAV